jgi:hypothetical protein
MPKHHTVKGNMKSGGSAPLILHIMELAFSQTHICSLNDVEGK